MAMLRHPGARSLLVFTWLSGCAVVPAALAGLTPANCTLGRWRPGC
jgi:hypothetical protein